MKRFDRRTLVRSFAAGSLSAFAPKIQAYTQYLPEDLTVDVCVLGAGAAGMFAASRLRELGYNVVVVEKEAHVGGHALTYEERETGIRTELGVRTYPDLPIIRQTFQNYDLSLKEAKAAGSKRAFVDFEKGSPSTYTPPNPLETAEALRRFNKIRDENYSFLNKPGFNPPALIPLELFKPFQQFLSDNDLQAAYPALATQLMGRGKTSEIPTFYALKALRKDIVLSIMNDSFVKAEAGAQSIYNRMAEKLGKNVITSAHVQSIQRSGSGGVNILLCLGRDKSRATLIRANKLVLACPPSQDNMSFFDLDTVERNLFDRFRFKQYWTSLVHTKGFFPDVALMNNRGQSEIDSETFAEQAYPGIFIIAPTPIPGLMNILYGSKEELTEEEVKLKITTDIEKLQGDIIASPIRVQGFERFQSHSPYSPMVSNLDIALGFYRNLERLQGYRGTYYVGSAFDSNDTSSVWLHAKSIVELNFPPKTV